MRNDYKLRTQLALVLMCFMGVLGVQAQTIQLGTGLGVSGNTTASPVNGYYNYMRYQTVYTAAEINAQGIFGPINLTDIAYYVTAAPAGGLPNYEIRMANTSAANCAAHVADPLTSVYTNAAPTWTAGAWNTLTLSAPFLWDGTSNLLVDVNFGLAPFTSPYGSLRTYALTDGSRYVRCDSSLTCGPQTNVATTSTQATKPQVQLTFLPSASCAGTPIAGTASATASVCSAVDFDLTLIGFTPDGDITLQWQSSPDGNTYTDILGATAATENVSQTSDTYYQCVVTCTNSGQSDTSNVVFVTMVPFLTCYCPSAASNTADTKIDSVRFLTVLTGSALSTCETYTDYSSLVATIPQTVPFFLNIRNGHCDVDHYDAYVSVYIDYDHNGVLDDSGELVYSFGPTTAANTIPPALITVPNTAMLGQTRMRIILAEGAAIRTPCEAYSYGETEDYTLDITAAPACTTPPAGGTASGPSAADVGPAYLYEVTGSTGNIQWQYSTTSATGPFTDFTGAYDDSVYVIFNANGTYWLRAFVTSPGCDPDSSNAVETVVQLLGDDVCDAITLSFGSNGPFSTVAATAQSGEPAPSGGGCEDQMVWCSGDTTVTNSRWFKFAAPASGRVRIYSPGFDTQLALWDALTCDTILQGGATLIGANDDDPEYVAHGAAVFSSRIDSAVCLTPGKTYYVQLDPYTSPGDITTIVLTDLGGPVVTLNTKTDISCFGLTDGAIDMDVTGGSGSYTYEWSSGETTEDITGLPASTYTLTVTEAGCEATVSSSGITINEPAALNVVLDSLVNVRCFGDSTGGVYITVTGGTIPYNFDWSDGSSNEDLTGVPAGIYSGTLTDANGCSTSSPPFPITEPATALAVTLDSVTDNLCAGLSAGAIYVTASGGTPGYTYSWNGGPTTTTDDFTGLPAGPFGLQVWDANGCMHPIVNATVGEAAPVVVTVDSIHHVSCFNGNDGAIYISITGGTPGYTKVWSNGPVTEDNINLATGSYNVTVTDINGCTANESATVLNGTPIVVSIDSLHSVTCNGLSNGGIFISVSGGTPGYNYSWCNGTTTQDNNLIVAGPCTVTVTDTKNCSATSTITISQPAVLAISVDSIHHVSCFGGSTGAIYTTAFGGTTPYVPGWSNGMNSLDISSLAAGNYSVTLSDNNGCTTATSATVNQATAVTGTSVSTDQIQGGALGSIDITASGGTLPYTFLWSNSSTTEDLANVPAGPYCVTITDNNGCTGVICDTVSFITGIGNLENVIAVNLYPNPTQDKVFLELSLSAATDVTVEVYNVSGQLVSSLMRRNMQDAKFEMNFAAEPSGVYHAKIKAGDVTLAKRIVVTR